MSLLGRQGTADSASQSEAMTVAVGLSPRGVSAKTYRRGATHEGLNWLFGSGVAPRGVAVPDHHPYHREVAPRLLQNGDAPGLLQGEIRAVALA